MRCLLWLSVVVIGILAGSANGQTNLALLVSQSGDYIGAGQTYVTTNESSISLSGNLGTVSVGAFGFTISMDAQGSSNLFVGTYTNATRYPFNGASSHGLSISGNGRGCNTLCGDFQIFELATNGTQVIRLWAKFTQRCECGTPQLTGEIRYRSQLAPAAPEPRTIRVPADFSTIQAAIDEASLFAVDTVLVSPGTYTQSLTFKGKRVRVLSTDGPAVTLIRPTAGNGVTFNNGETVEAVFAGFTITNAPGGGISVGNCSPTIESNVVINCTGTGINVQFASPIIRSNRIVNASGNAFTLGGAASPLLEKNIIENNGGGIDMFAAGTPTIRNNWIRDNRGYGMSMVNTSDANIVQNIISGNASHGITWLVPSGARGPYVINNTIFGNTGAGIMADGYDVNSQIVNNIVVGNPALQVGNFNDNNLPLIRFNNFYSRTGAAYSGSVSNLTGIHGNISTEPFFTCEPSRNFRLLRDSLCVDRGSNSAPALLPTDFDGETRQLIGNPSNAVVVIDLGAFEMNPATATDPCLYVSCPSNIVVTAVTGQNSAAVNYAAPTATPGASVVTSPASGSVFAGGVNTVSSTATYGTNTVSCSFLVTVLVRPAITNQPASLTVSAGDPATFSVGTIGTAPLSYQWSLEGVNIVGATNSTYTIAAAQASHAGYYRVTVSSSLGSATSAAALLRVLPAAPSLLSEPASQTVSAGSDATLAVGAKGSAPLTYYWYFNNALLASSASSQLNLPNVQTENSGTYRVVVSNAFGTATSSNAQLNVLASAPYFVIHPANKIVVSGTNVSLVSRAAGSDPLNYQWLHNGSPLAGATGATLNLTNVSSTNAGTYASVATNNLGSVTSMVATVSVRVAPHIIAGLTNQIAISGNTVTLSVLAGGSGDLAYNWQFNGATIPGTNSSLVLSNVAPEQTGYYRVGVTSQYGSTSSVARLSVFMTPSPVVAWGDNTAGQTNLPSPINDGIAVAGGDFHSMALRANGSLVTWGTVPEASSPHVTNRFVGIAAGASHSLGITMDGSVLAWGRNDYGQLNVPASAKSVLGIAAGEAHSIALLSTGSLVTWGDNTFGQTNIPGGLTTIRAIAAGHNHNLALRNNGTVASWGHNGFGQTTVPQGLASVKAVAAGYFHSVALRSNGTVVVWGDNTYGQLSQPVGLSNVVAIAAGDLHTYALLSNGNVVAWGDNFYGQTNLPSGLQNVRGISSGYYHGLALVVPILQYTYADGNMTFDSRAQGVLQWSSSPLGPFNDVDAGTTNITIDGSASAKFYRWRLTGE